MLDKKYCPKCTKHKPLDQFGKDRTQADNLNIWCKDCRSKYHRAYRVQLNEYASNSTYLAEYYSNSERTKHFRKYGISIAEYEKLYQQQNGVCAICGQSETDKIKSGKQKYLAVDHDHTTGKIRGLLCKSCNIKLSVLENALFVERANIYLAKYETNL